LERRKGHRLLIDALGLLRDRPGWVLWQVGGIQRPAEAQYLEALAARTRTLGIGDRVRWLGERSDVFDLLAAADLHCQPNETPEPFGITFVEALASGVPVVTTDFGGAREIVDASCGVLVPPGDPVALAAALERLLCDPGLRAALGASGPARARALCDPAQQVRRLELALAHAAGQVEAGAGRR
jgi:glycosyltransferase involved in cell wall biosynthesis